jgi:hypothetical protein
MEGGMGMPLLFMSDTNENDTLSPLETRVAFVGMMDETEDWARAIWRHNPQFLDFYKTSRLANIEDHLYDYDKWDSVREDYRNGRRTAFFYDKAAGKDVEKIVYADSREELKRILLAEARSFIPDPDDHGKEMNEFFDEYGRNWMMRGLPTRWQEFFGACMNPDYNGSLSWDEGADGDKELISSFEDAPVSEDDDDEWD